LTATTVIADLDLILGTKDAATPGKATAAEQQAWLKNLE
jgi:hypothetical protein